MTKRLYHDDAYLKQCTANVVSIKGNTITLDQTMFFAFSGGQASDKGTIGGIAVRQAIAEGDDILYVLEQEPTFNVGDTVDVVIDWDYRYKIMKLHSATHIVVDFWEKEHGKVVLIGSNVDITKGRFDFEYNESVSSFLPALEKQVNDFISLHHDIKRYADPEDASRRVWECAHMKMPCGGTHLKNTKEIGSIKLKRKNIGSGKERIEIILVE